MTVENDHGWRNRFASAMLSMSLIAPIGAAAQDLQSVNKSDGDIPPAAPSAQDTPVLASIEVGTKDVPLDAHTGSAAKGRSASRLVEEIVVTAQKREERIEDVPIAISAFSADKLEALGIQSAEDLERVTPGLTITNAGGYNLVYLRGVGTDAFLPGADSSVPFYLDGVALLGNQGSTDTLGRIQRVEVLKGPQGTLFGRNATGGAISIVTPDPTNTFEGDLSVEAGNYTARKGLGYLNVPIMDGLAVNMSAFDTSQSNFYTNDAGPIADVYSRGGRAKLRWDVSNDLSLTLAASFQKSSSSAGLDFENTRVAPVLRAVLPQDPKADRHVSTDSLSGARTNSQLYAGTLAWKLNWIDTKLILSQQRLNTPFVQADFDTSVLPIINVTSLVQLSKQRTAELQFLSNNETPFSSHFKWVAGLFYFESSGGYNPIQFDVAPNALATLGVPAGSFLTTTLDNALGMAGLPSLASGVKLLNYGVLKSKSISGYFQGTYSVLESVDFTAGVRYEKDKRDLDNSHTAIAPQAGGEPITIFPTGGGTYHPPTLRAQPISPHLALQWRPFDEDTQLYTSWGRAFKSPTYNTVNLLGTAPSTLAGAENGSIETTFKPVKAERVDTFELGTKTALFNRNLRLNSAAFYTKQHDLLTGFVAVETGGIVSYDNVPGARIYGIEGDGLWTPLPDLDAGLVLTGAFTIINAKYTDYPEGKGFDEATGLAFGADGTEALPARNFKGNRIVRTPKYTGSFGISQTIPVTDGSLEFAGDVNYNSGFFFLPQNSKLYAREANTLVNVRATYLYEPWATQLSFFVNNLTQETYNEIVFVYDFGRNQILNAPRTYGLRLKWTF